MTVYDTADIRNVALVGHGATGKTCLASAMLFTSGAVNRMGKIEDGTATTDFDEEEIARKISLQCALAHLEWVWICQAGTSMWQIKTTIESRSSTAMEATSLSGDHSDPGLEISTARGTWLLTQAGTSMSRTPATSVSRSSTATGGS